MTRNVAVIDIGKTNAKLALVELDGLTEISVRTRPNVVRPGPPWPHFDIEGHWDFILRGLREMNAAHGIDAISVTTHGASVVLVDAAGRLAAPVLDYEHPGPDAIAAEYDAIRPAFSETGSPRVGMGLNLGAQLFWEFREDPDLLSRTRHILTYPQYWSFRLSGVAATEMTSLGAHTDLWEPGHRRFSVLVDRLGIHERLAPIREAGEVLGPVLPDIAKMTGLGPDVQVFCGIHDSNASLLPHLMTRDEPFSVVSTGTWVIVMSLGGRPVGLDPRRDTLMNVNAFGAPVPSARFMGGREFDLATGGACPEPTDEDMRAVLAAGTMLMPSVVPETGPFQGAGMRWPSGEPPEHTGQRGAAVAFYLALMTAICLELVGHRGDVVVEGPFARNRAYCDMLAAASNTDVERMKGSTGTSQGAALLALQDTTHLRFSGEVTRLDVDWRSALQTYATQWRRRL